MNRPRLLRALLDTALRHLPPDLQEPARALLDRWLQARDLRQELRAALHRAHECFVRHAAAENPDLARYAQDNPLTDAASLLQALERTPDPAAWEAALHDLVARAWRGLPPELRARAAHLYTLCLRQALLALPTHSLPALGRELADQRALLEALRRALEQEQRRLEGEIRLAARAVHIETPRAEIQAETVVVRPREPAWTPPHTPAAPPDPEGPLPEPGPLPAGSRVPVPPNPDFTGREGELRALARALLHGTGFRAVAVHGPGGVGKTQLAAAFARRFGRHFCAVLWMPAAQSPEEAFFVWAEELHRAGWFPGVKALPEKADDRAAMVRALWQRHGPWLVVLDDLPDPRAADAWLRGWSDLNLAVLLTGRAATWPAYVRPLALASFTPREARAYLRRRLPYEALWPAAHLGRLAERLGRLPLALELAAAHLHRYRLPIPAYLQELEAVGALVHESMQDAPAPLPTGHDPDLHATFALSLERVREEDPGAVELFGYLGHLAPGQPVPLDLPALSREPAWAERPLRAALARLAEHSLVRWREDAAGPEVHPLLAELARLEAGPGPEALQAWAERVAGEFAARWEEEIERRAAYAAWAPYRPHLAALAKAAGETDPAARVWNLLGLYAEKLGEYHEARELHEQALAIVRKVYGEEHPSVAASLTGLAAVLQALGDYDRARQLHEQALAIRRKLYGEEHPDVATSLNNLAAVLQALGDYDRARELFEQALAIWRQVYGEEHPSVATSLNNLALVLEALGDYHRAREMHEQALSIRRQVYGEEHPSVATSLNNLAEVLRALGDYDRARQLHEQALAIRRKLYGEEHPDVATSLNNLAGVLEALGDYEQARELYERALEIFRKTLPPGHPYIRTVEGNLKRLGKGT